MSTTATGSGTTFAQHQHPHASPNNNNVAAACARQVQRENLLGHVHIIVEDPMDVETSDNDNDGVVAPQARNKPGPPSSTGQNKRRQQARKKNKLRDERAARDLLHEQESSVHEPNPGNPNGEVGGAFQMNGRQVLGADGAIAQVLAFRIEFGGETDLKTKAKLLDEDMEKRGIDVVKKNPKSTAKGTTPKRKKSSSSSSSSSSGGAPVDEVEEMDESVRAGCKMHQHVIWLTKNHKQLNNPKHREEFRNGTLWNRLYWIAQSTSSVLTCYLLQFRSSFVVFDTNIDLGRVSPVSILPEMGRQRRTKDFKRT